MLFKKSDIKEKISQGAVFLRTMRVNAREEARVLYVSEDEQGISHVHYERTLIGSCYKEPAGTRVLSLDTFARDFQVN
ncbi:hypothetical protein [Sneathiella limimaris]|uniref:hypothetical protein n=1 Tax=Sneathiella limimaris TaxID=1964213 RepID=UPI00146A48F1|nr:hypothetical protein [Sneathiella limimaris]